MPGIRYNLNAVVLLIPKPTVSHYRSSLAVGFLVTLLILNPRTLGQTKASSPATARLSYQRGQHALRKGDLAAARSDLDEAVRRSARDPQYRADVGWLLSEQGELDAAVRHL